MSGIGAVKSPFPASGCELSSRVRTGRDERALMLVQTPNRCLQARVLRLRTALLPSRGIKKKSPQEKNSACCANAPKLLSKNNQNKTKWTLAHLHENASNPYGIKLHNCTKAELCGN